MDAIIATSAPATTGPIHFLNIEYFFYLIYTWTHGGVAGSATGAGSAFNVGGLVAFATITWVIITIFAYVLVAGFLGLLIYSTIRMHQVEDADSYKYQTISDVAHAQEETEHHRWTHVRELIESASPNDWRQAIIEADIILEDMLNRLGYGGATIGEKLKTANPAHFKTLQEAWEAHKVRNEIAHQGSEFPLTDRIAYRTILQYENVFKEHGEI